MQTRNLTSLVAFAAAAVLAPTAQAAEWDGSDSNEWTVDSNWDASYPNAAGAVANFGIAAAVNVSSPITVGQITDTGAGTDSWINSLTASGTGSITFDNNGADALFNATAHFYRTPANTTYSVPIVLNDNLVINYSTQRHRNFNGPISGSGHLTLNIHGNDGVSFSISGSSANTYSGGTTVNNNKQFSWNTPPLVLLDKDGAMGTGDVTLVAVSAFGASKVTITSSGGDEDRIDDSAMLILNYDATGGYTVVTLDTGVEETVGGLTLDGTVMPAGTYNATTHPDWFAGDGDLIVGGAPPTADPEITSIAVLGNGDVVLTTNVAAAGLTAQQTDDLTLDSFSDVASSPSGNTLTIDSSLVDPNADGAVFFRVRE